LFYDFMRELRVREVHKRGSQRNVKVEEIPIHGTCSDASGRVEVFSPPATLEFRSSPAIIRKPAFSFTIGGIERKATDACADYLALLVRMVTQLKTDRPLAPANAQPATGEDSSTAAV
jgi:hypothetical protein